MKNKNMILIIVVIVLILIGLNSPGGNNSEDSTPTIKNPSRNSCVSSGGTWDTICGESGCNDICRCPSTDYLDLEDQKCHPLTAEIINLCNLMSNEIAVCYNEEGQCRCDYEGTTSYTTLSYWRLSTGDCSCQANSGCSCRGPAGDIPI